MADAGRQDRDPRTDIGEHPRNPSPSWPQRPGQQDICQGEHRQRQWPPLLRRFRNMQRRKEGDKRYQREGGNHSWYPSQRFLACGLASVHPAAHQARSSTGQYVRDGGVVSLLGYRGDRRPGGRQAEHCRREPRPRGAGIKGRNRPTRQPGEMADQPDMACDLASQGRGDTDGQQRGAGDPEHPDAEFQSSDLEHEPRTPQRRGRAQPDAENPASGGERECR